MPDVTLTTLQGLKQRGEKIVMLTSYDATFAAASCAAGVEVLLVLLLDVLQLGFRAVDACLYVLDMFVH